MAQLFKALDFRLRRTRALLVVPLVLIPGVACEKRSEAGGTSAFFAFADSAVAKPDPVVKERPRLRKQAFYQVSLQGVPLGTAVAARNENGESFPSSVQMRLIHRLGGSTVMSTYESDATSGKPSSVNGKPTAGEADGGLAVRYELTQGKDSLHSETARFHSAGNTLVRDTEATPSIARVLSLATDGHELAQPSVPFERWAFFGNASGSGRKDMPGAVNPFTGLPVPPEDTATYGEDGFLTSGTLTWLGLLQLTFTRVEEEKLKAFATDIFKTPVELAWFSTQKSLAPDVRRLLADSESCSTFARDAENQVRREFPQLPYLMHRRIYNFGILCMRLSTILSKPEARTNPTKTLDDVHWIFRIVLEEDKDELPSELLIHPDVAVLADASRRWQWARAASQILRATHEELSDLVALERAQKVNLAMRVSIDRLATTAVVKGVLRAKDVRFKTEVRTAEGNRALATSWMRLPEALVRPLRLASTARAAVKFEAPTRSPVSFELLHGQAFARGEAAPVSAVCENFSGKVGLDLGNAPNTVISNGLARGVWDDTLRLALVREFAKRAGSHPACRQVIFSVPKNLVASVQAELKAFDKNILQNDSEFQISNRAQRRMRVQPGTYELTLTSLVTREVIGTREILIPDGRQNLAVNVKFP